MPIDCTYHKSTSLSVADSERQDIWDDSETKELDSSPFLLDPEKLLLRSVRFDCPETLDDIDTNESVKKPLLEEILVPPGLFEDVETKELAIPLFNNEPLRIVLEMKEREFVFSPLSLASFALRTLEMWSLRFCHFVNTASESILKPIE